MPFLASQGTSIIRTTGEALPAANLPNRASNPFKLRPHLVRSGRIVLPTLSARIDVDGAVSRETSKNFDSEDASSFGDRRAFHVERHQRGRFTGRPTRLGYSSGTGSTLENTAKWA